VSELEREPEGGPEAERVHPRPPCGWIGVNFWSRAGGPRMWSRYDPAVVEAELETLAEAGLTHTRSFCFWPDFMPEAGRVEPEMLARLVDFLDLHQRHRLQTIVTFVVGHMSGGNWDPPFRNGRDVYRDVSFLAEQAILVSEVAAATKDHPAVAGWLLSNEIPLYGGPVDEESATAWSRLLLLALRATGARQPASIGDGAWGLEVSGSDNGFSLRRLGPLVDWIGPHVYPSSQAPVFDDAYRRHTAAALACLLSAVGGRPVVLEEFGVSSDLVDDEDAVTYYRQVLAESLLAGAVGHLAWNNCDFDDLVAEAPYRHHSFELHFGLTDGQGRPKPALGELTAFAPRLRLVAETGLRPPPPEAALVVPEAMERRWPFFPEAERRVMRDHLHQAYVAARSADLAVGIVREADGLRGGSTEGRPPLYLLPATKVLAGPTWPDLVELARDGALVYWSYFAGETGHHPGPWTSGLEAVFGIRHHLRYGLAAPVEEPLELTFVKDFGSLAAGTRLAFAVAGEPPARSRLPFEVTTAEVLATDAAGRPLLARRLVGAGALVALGAPVEHWAAVSRQVNPEDTWRLYDALAVAAGIPRPVRVPDPRVVVGRLDAPDGRHSLLVVRSEADEEVEIAPELAPDVEVASLGPSGLTAGASLERLRLSPHGVGYYLLQGKSKTS